ncbi:hypothetical protein Hypma_016586 [Hypsizygus marmoreus]|uniref:Uncharacterized protein n=1 Tax=Hypsizygus marmoreus TaxID=39966 RepID=A0A369J2H6_HYPMA|nr:hypothetical protein Hypma_016586 [Hypsizygus marmoreus]
MAAAVAPFSVLCSCHRAFTSPGAFKNHQNTCTSSKRRLSTALRKARDSRDRRLGLIEDRSGLSSLPTPALESNLSDEANASVPEPEEEEIEEVPEVQVPPPKRRRTHVLPAHLRSSHIYMHDKTLKDILPQPVTPLPTPVPPAPQPAPSTILPQDGDTDMTDIHHIDDNDTVDCVISTSANIFGIFRRYYGLKKLPNHDPERDHTMLTLSDIVDQNALSTATPSVSASPTSISAFSSPTSAFYPYPNKSSFALGDWYWNGGAQKSKGDLKRLLDILNDYSFSLDDIRKTNWSRINRQLAVNEWDEGEWVDEDAGWQRRSVSIRVPFHRYTESPGTRDYLAANFYH